MADIGPCMVPQPLNGQGANDQAKAFKQVAIILTSFCSSRKALVFRKSRVKRKIRMSRKIFTKPKEKRTC